MKNLRTMTEEEGAEQSPDATKYLTLKSVMSQLALPQSFLLFEPISPLFT